MSSPTSSLSTLRPELGSMLEFDLAANRAGYIATKVAPVLEVAKQTGTFGKYTIEQLLQTKDTVRAPGAPYGRSKSTFGTATYACVENGWEEPVDDREAEMYSDYIDAEMIATERCLSIVQQNAEIRWATAIFNASTWTGSTLTTAITHEWDDFTNAVPVSDVAAAKLKVYDLTGIVPNALVINWRTYQNLRMCAEVIDRLESAGAGVASDPSSIGIAQLQSVFDLSKIIVAGGIKNTANEVLAASLSPVWSNEYAMVCRVAETNNIKEPCIARTFHWGADGSSIGGTVESYRDETVRSNIIRVRHDVDELVMYTECGHLLSNIIT